MKLIFVISALVLCALSIVSSVPVGDFQSILSGRIQEAVNPDGSINQDWLSDALDGLATFVVSNLSDPNNIEEERQSIRIVRLFIEAILEYQHKNMPKNSVVYKLLYTMKSFISSLEKKVNDGIGQITFSA